MPALISAARASNSVACNMVLPHFLRIGLAYMLPPRCLPYIQVFSIALRLYPVNQLLLVVWSRNGAPFTVPVPVPISLCPR